MPWAMGQGGLFSAMVDMSPTDTSFQVAPGLTDVTILDYDFVHYINFEAEINFPEEEGIVQVPPVPFCTVCVCGSGG